jgi:RecA-family ATPase/5S rRNA maturation endonuclease (ribonuclease M5)
VLEVNWNDYNDAPLQAAPVASTAPSWATGEQYDRDEVRTSLLRQLESVLGYLYPSGFADPKGKTFYVGSIAGEPGESLNVVLTGDRAGLWHDFATAEGGDIFDLWQAARALPSFRETIKDAALYSGAAANTPRRMPKRKQPSGGESWGAPVCTYRYLDTQGNIVAEVERFEWEKDGERKKAFRPWDVATRRHKAPETRPLYNLPNIATAPEIVIVEGEKAADALISQNIDATTAMGGASAPMDKTDWSVLTGRRVVIWPDNDAPGKAYAERLKGYLEGVGVADVSILAIPPHRPQKWDAADAFEEDLGALIKAMRADATQPKRASRFFSAADLAGIIVPPRQWHVVDLIPARQVTILGGDGGVGKSLLALQLAVASATGTSWIGRNPTKTRTVYVSAEDDQDEIHRRLDDITTAEGMDMRRLSELTLRSLAGEDALLAVADNRSGTLNTTPLLTELDQCIGDSQAGLLILDTLADLHSGQENDRAVARQFIGILRGLALRHDCTVILLAHPSLSGMSSGSGLSGSTAWNNSVRSRLYFERVIEDGYEPDADQRKLTNKKANYARTGQEILVRWCNGLFVPEDAPSFLDLNSASMKAHRVFLKLLKAYTEEGRNVNANGGSNYAPTVFTKDSRCEKVSRNAFQQAMNELFASGRIAQEEVGRPGKRTSRIVEVE